MAKIKTACVGLRLKEPLRLRVEQAAKKSGLSMNAEMVRRLELSFRDDQLVNILKNILSAQQGGD